MTCVHISFRDQWQTSTRFDKCSKISNTFLFLFSNKLSWSELEFTKCLSELQTGKTLFRNCCLGLLVRQLVFETLKHLQGSHRLEKYLNLEGFLEKSLKIKSALKNTGKSLKSLEKSLNSTLFFIGLSTVDGDQNQYKIVVPLFGAAYASPHIGTTILSLFSSTNVSIISV